MARNIYGFMKVEHKQTRRGIYLAVIGGATIACLVIMLLVSFFLGGTLPPAAGALGYLSFFIAIVVMKLSLDLRADDEAYGPMVHSACYVTIAAVVVHAMIFLIGCMSLIN